MATYLRCRCPGGYDSDDHHRNVARGLCLNRCAKCGKVPFGPVLEDIPLVGTARDTFYFRNVVRCGHWTCPTCGARIARDVAGKLGCAIQMWLARNDGYRPENAPYDVWLFTVTTPHRADEPMETVIARLYEAWDRFADSRAWKAWCRRVGLRARTRAFDVTFGGPNGTHPHFHLALFVAGVPGFRNAAGIARTLGGHRGTAFEVPRELVQAWERALLRAYGWRPPQPLPFDGHAFDQRALQLQGGDEAAAYFVKWGLASEAVATGIKAKGPHQLLDLAGAGDVLAGELYRAFCLAVNGRQVVTGVADTLRALNVSEDDIEEYRVERQAYLDRQSPPTLVPPLALLVRRCLWKTACVVGHGAVVAEVRRARDAGEDVQGTLDTFLFAAARELRPIDAVALEIRQARESMEAVANRTANARDGCNPPRESDRAPPVARMQLLLN